MEKAGRNCAGWQQGPRVALRRSPNVKPQRGCIVGLALFNPDRSDGLTQ
jgi:hypothetical protein